MRLPPVQKSFRRSYRIVKSRYAHDAMSGEGARLYGGRWNPPGVALVYTASSLALATLEMLVHCDDFELLAKLFVVVPIEIPEAKIASVDLTRLPEDWQCHPPGAVTQRLGREFASNRESLALEVPSAVVPMESNFLVNPMHPAIDQVQVGEIFSFDPDKRLG